jgi:hypothetical protein
MITVFMTESTPAFSPTGYRPGPTSAGLIGSRRSLRRHGLLKPAGIRTAEIRDIEDKNRVLSKFSAIERDRDREY